MTNYVFKMMNFSFKMTGWSEKSDRIQLAGEKVNHAAIAGGLIFADGAAAKLLGSGEIYTPFRNQL